MNKTLVLALLFGLVSQAEAIKISSNNFSNELKQGASNVQNIHLQLAQSQQKAAEAKQKSSETLKKINELKQKLGDKKPVENNKIQTKDDKNMVINIGALSEPDNGNKIQELEAMEAALAKASEEAHSQKLKIIGSNGLS